MGVCDKFIGMVKTNTKVFCKDTIENLTKDCTGGSCPVLRSKPILPRGRMLISIGSNNNVHKFLYFIVTYNTGRTQSGLSYLSKYPDYFSNIVVLPVYHLIVVYKFFGSVN